MGMAFCSGRWGRGVRLGQESQALERAGDEGRGNREPPGQRLGRMLALRAERAKLALEVAPEPLLELPLHAQVLEVPPPAEEVQPRRPARGSQRLAAEALAGPVDRLA